MAMAESSSESSTSNSDNESELQEEAPNENTETQAEDEEEDYVPPGITAPTTPGYSIGGTVGRGLLGTGRRIVRAPKPSPSHQYNTRTRREPKKNE